MKQSVTRFDFVDWFRGSDTYKRNFSYDGLNSLFDYFEELEEQMENEMDFDPIAICCEFSEYENFEEIKENYNSTDIQTMDDLRNYTSVIEIENTDRLIIQDF